MNNLVLSENKNSIGITVNGIDLAHDLLPLQIIQIQQLLNKYKVVVFKKQNLTDENLSNFAFRFGPPFIPDNKFPVLGSQDAINPIIIVGNQAHEYSKSYLGHQEVLPHSDHQWLKCPSSASLLYAIDIEEKSAPTIWFDMVEAYKMLDPETCAIINDLKIVTYNPFFRPFGSVSSKYVNPNENIPHGDKFPHPLVRTHPLTQEKILYMNIAYEIEYENITFDVGNNLFNRLYEHILNLNCNYKHNWENGDLVFWDNRATIHYRPSFDSNVRRVLKRITIGGEMPF